MRATDADSAEAPAKAEGKARSEWGVAATGAAPSIAEKDRRRRMPKERTLDLNQLLLREHHLSRLLRTEARSQGARETQDMRTGMWWKQTAHTSKHRVADMITHCSECKTVVKADTVPRESHACPIRRKAAPSSRVGHPESQEPASSLEKKKKKTQREILQEKTTPRGQQHVRRSPESCQSEDGSHTAALSSL